MESNSVCYHTSDKQNRTTAKRESDLSIMSLITDRIEWHEVLLPINHNRFNFRKEKQKHLGQTSLVEKMSKIQNSSILEIPQVVVAMVFAINSVIGFYWVDLVWLAASTVRLQVFDYSQPSEYTVRLQLYIMSSEK